ncbi:hypothetical protein [Desulforamulus hydrothermalis]|uniref:hypothetical protein n=1 Tax=Desulforamulus hydrothermalis TaxID=412895 RepID=UPI00066281BF|nr:hypothetical protein [Desulforamulus hydrothermalis]SHH43640.1 hypothetical protein SAMN02745177_02550 [Desulforamulus hydrothermalis Lam5 = DSM 18033]
MKVSGLISELITQAQQMGITVYHHQGQVQVKIPWPVERIPDPARAILGAIRELKPEVLAYFALTEPFNAQLVLAALEAQGVRLVPDQLQGFRIFINPKAPGRCEGTAIKLINKLNDHRSAIIPYLSGQQAPPG